MTKPQLAEAFACIVAIEAQLTELKDALLRMSNELYKDSERMIRNHAYPSDSEMGWLDSSVIPKVIEEKKSEV